MIRSKEFINFYPLGPSERTICDKLKLPFINSVVLGGLVYFGDLKDKEKYLKIIEVEEKRLQEIRNQIEKGELTI